MASWLAAHVEDHTGAAADLNQYWYSADTIDALLDVVREHGLGAAEPNGKTQLDVAFVSTPSLFFGLSEKERRNCRVLDYDEGLGDDVVFWEVDCDPGFAACIEQLSGFGDAVGLDTRPSDIEAARSEEGVRHRPSDE